MKKILTLLLTLALCAGLSAPALAAQFTDVPGTHTFYTAISDCAAKGIASGYADGSFKPAAQVTRAQFCVMLSRAFYADEAAAYNTEEFTSIAWFAPYAEALSRAGVLENTSFQADCRSAAAMNRPVSRYDMAQIIANILAQKGGETAQDGGVQGRIADYASIPQQYREAVKTVFALGVINGYADGSFGGEKVMNRGQGCVVIHRMSQYMDSNAPSGKPEETPEKTPDKAPEQAPEKAPDKTPEQAPEKTPDPQPSTTTPEAAAAELARLLNAERAKAGLQPLEPMDGLTQAARIRARDLSGGYVEIRADGSDWTSVLKQSGVKADYVDESFVVGKGYDDTASALEKVLSTPEAKAALLNREYTHLGVGFVHDENGYLGLQDFWSLMYIVESSGESPSESPAPEAPAPSGTDLQAMRQGVLDLVNAARAENGKSALTLDEGLCDVAQLRAEEIVESFSHTRPNGTSCFTAIQEAGIRGGAMGENIAAGQGSPAAVMNSWMNSDGHRKNILSGNFSSIGIGYVKSSSGYGHYWVQMFLG